MGELYAALGALALAVVSFLAGRFIPTALQPTVIALARALIGWIIARQTKPLAPSEIVRQYYRELPELVDDLPTRRKLETIERDRLLQIVQEQLLRGAPVQPK